MKRFIVSVLSVSVFFLGLGTLIEKVGARFKSDEKALELIRAARTAIGGDNAIAGIQSLRIKGTSTHTFKVDGTERSENGETEIAMQLPDKLSKKIKIGSGDEMPGDQIVNKRVETVIVRTDKDGSEIGTGKGTGTGTGIGAEPGKRVVIVNDGDAVKRENHDGQVVITRKVGDGDLPARTENGELRTFKVDRSAMEAHHREAQTNELFRLTLSLFLSPPTAMAVNYTFGGEVKAADRPCNLVIAELAGSSVKLYLDRDSNLPVMMTYTDEAMPMILHFNKSDAPTTDNGGDNVVFFRKTEGPAANTEYTVRFDDYRGTNGVQLPYKWVTTGGDMTEVFTVTEYEVNPADISNSFQEQKLKVRVKADGQ